jgi:hypothetical protein
VVHAIIVPFDASVDQTDARNAPVPLATFLNDRNFSSTPG